MAESLEEAKIFSGDGEEREEEDVEALPTEQTELSKPVSADIDTAKEEEEEEEKIFSGDGEEREKEDLEAEPTEPTELSKPVLADIDIAELREAASAHYDGLTDDQKEEATRLFNNMDKNEDGGISIDEFKTFLSVAGLHIVNPDNLFAKLDKDGNKSLSFDELVTFFYVLSHDEYKHRLIDKSSTDVRGQEASIAPGTVRGANDKVRIAPGTARGANDKVRSFSLTTARNHHLKPVSAEIDIKKKVREAASAHLKDLTEDQKKEARSLFDTMDKDENGNISSDAFKTFLSDAGLQTVDPDGLFAELDKDASETLSFEELVTFFYVLSRDENKDRWKRKPSTDVHGQEARIAPGTARGANDKGHKWTKFSPRLYDKFKGTYKLEEVSENSCTIL